MTRDLTLALDESLALLQTGQATLEECVARYPELAADLRPLLETAVHVSDLSAPTASPAAFADGKQRMLAALAEKRRRPAVSAGLSFGTLRSQVGRFVRGRDIPAPRRLPTFGVALGAALALAIVVLLGVLLPSWLRPSVAHAATLEQVTGLVELRSAGSASWRTVSAGVQVAEGDRVRTGADSATTLAFFDGSATELEADTEVAVVQMDFQRGGDARIILLQQTAGQTYSRVHPLPDPAARFEIDTPTAVAVVREAELALSVETDGTTRVLVVAGMVDVTAQETTVAVAAGQETDVQPRQPPRPSRPIVATPVRKATAVPAGTPGPKETPEPPGKTKPAEPPGQNKTPEPPDKTKPSEPPGQNKTLEPPGQSKTREPSSKVKPVQPPGQKKTSRPLRHQNPHGKP